MGFSWDINKEASGFSLLQFLKRSIPNFSNKQLKSALEQGCCKKNGVIERFGSKKIAYQDRIYFHLPKVEGSKFLEIDVLFEDEHFLIIDKPVGIECSKTVLRKVFSQIFLVHRLDKLTSGVLILAKSTEAQLRLQRLFRLREIHKTYLAYVDGIVQKKKGKISSYLIKKGFFQGQTLWGSNHQKQGRYAETSWELVEVKDDYSILRLFPKTGRTHQLRVHLKELGHPILGDFQYCRKFHCSLKVHSLLLHASEISFVHPYSEEKLTVKAPFVCNF